MPRLNRLLVLTAIFLAGCHKFPDVSTNTLGWVHSDGSKLVDQYGRQLIIRGINARVSGLFDVTFADGRQPVETIPDFTAEDAQQMAAAGFNFLRLPIDWSGLEPTEGQFSQTFLARLEQVVEWCRQAGLYVLIDFHQDSYSKEIGEDGAPLWAIYPPPTMLLGGPLTAGRETSTQVVAADVSFFTDAQMLQERFLPAWQMVVSLHAQEPQVIGFEIMNEPPAFEVPDGEGESDLQSFYEKVAKVFRTVDTQHALWMEPDSNRNLTLSAPLRATPFPDSNVVYAPHMYPQSIIVTPPSNTAAGWASTLEQSFDDMLTEAASYGAAPMMDEWGQNPADPTQFPYFDGVEQLVEQRNLGEAFWLWKEDSQANWGFFDLNADGSWTVRAAGLKEVARPYPMAVPGTLNSFHFDPAAVTLTAQFTARGGEAAPLLFLSPAWFPNGVKATMNGTEISLGTGRVLLPWSGASGVFNVSVQAK